MAQDLRISGHGCHAMSAPSPPDGHPGNGSRSFRRHCTATSHAAPKGSAQGHCTAASLAASAESSLGKPQPNDVCTVASRPGSKQSARSRPHPNIRSSSKEEATLDVYGRGLLELSQATQWPRDLQQATSSSSTSPQRMRRRFSCPSGGELHAASSKESVRGRRRSVDVIYSEDAQPLMGTTHTSTLKSSHSPDKRQHLALPASLPQQPPSYPLSCPACRSNSAASSRAASKENVQGRRQCIDTGPGKEDTALKVDGQGLCDASHVMLPALSQQLSVDCAAPSCPTGGSLSDGQSHFQEMLQGTRRSGGTDSSKDAASSNIHGQNACEMSHSLLGCSSSRHCSPAASARALSKDVVQGNPWSVDISSGVDATSLNICGKSASIRGTADPTTSATLSSSKQSESASLPMLNSLLPTVEKLAKDRQRSEHVAQAKAKFAIAGKVLGALIAAGKSSRDSFWADDQEEAEDDARSALKAMRPSWQWDVAIARRATEVQPPVDVGAPVTEEEDMDQALPTLLQRHESGNVPKQNAAAKHTLHQGLPRVPTSRRGRSSSLSPARNSRCKSRSPVSGSGKGSRSSSRASGQGRKSRKHGEDDDAADAITRKQLDDFLAQLYQEYALVLDKSGRPLMNNPALRRFFVAFTGGTNSVVLARADQCYAEEIERQENMHYSFDLSKKDAGRGLCFKMFEILVQKSLPGGQSHELCRQNFLKFQGSAALMRERLSGDLKAA
eukprot:TRINITY_DN11142_c0_g1_i3.p1 TRINITY_DN11142_c0_g1~~TRINITY_DN11142_c0_g1_i3.p1  ORF type:complete len:729 (-),score=96.96 TRINITY_DN11142_c0_g1_i3:142-2328(-)